MKTQQERRPTLGPHYNAFFKTGDGLTAITGEDRKK